MLPSLQSRQNDFLVLMRGRGDQDRLHGFRFEQLAVIIERFRLRSRLLSASEEWRVAVADRDYGSIGQRRQGVGDLIASPGATADDPATHGRRDILFFE